MPYRLRYTANVDWVPAGTGATQPNSTNSANGASSGAQTKGFVNTPGGQNVLGGGTGGIINATDVTTLTNAMAADIAAQMNVAATLAQLQGFNSGGG